MFLNFLTVAVFSLYGALLLGLAILGAHRLSLIHTYYKHRKTNLRPKSHFDSLPVVTVQLPIYNEPEVCERLVQSVLSLDYPKELLEIQVLDDSTDNTSDFLERIVAEARREGFDISHIRREKREGFKAGALAYGLQLSRGEFVAVLMLTFFQGLLI